MSEKIENLSEYEKVKKFLEWANLPYTATEIYEFFNTLKIRSSEGIPFTKSTIRVYLKDLSNTAQIQSRELYGRRYNYYHAKKDESLNYLKLEIVGFWVEHYDEKMLLNSTKKRLEESNFSLLPKDIDSRFLSPKTENIFIEGIEDQEDLTISRKFALFQGTGIIDYYQISKITGLYPFQKFKEPMGIQPTFNKAWSKELKKMLESNYSLILTNGLIYFNKENIEEIEPPKRGENGLTTWKLRIPYYGHVFDEDKPGRMLDGQQRVMALDLMNLERRFKGLDSNPFLAPITVLIGDFSQYLVYEKKLLAKYFYLSNQAKNLPPLIIQEITENFISELEDFIPLKEKYNAFIDKIITLLDEDEKSPFYHEIDHESRRFNKYGKLVSIEGSELRLFSREAIKKMIHKALKGNPFNINLKRLDTEEVDIRMEKWLDIFIDYFNAIKCVFNEEWLEKNSIIRRNSGIFALGLLISSVWHHSLFRLDRSHRVKELIKPFAIWKDFDESLDFSETSDFNSRYYADTIMIAKDLFKTLKGSWISSTIEEQISDNCQIIIDNAEEIWEQIKVNY